MHDFFLIDYLFYDTNFPEIHVEYGKDGRITDEVRKKIYQIHPRILSGILDKVEIFSNKMPENEKKDLEKQCSMLFGDGKGINNPHKWITIYCMLSSFWEKFGLNYFDILKLPHETYQMLKHIMNLESTYKSKSIESTPTRKRM